MEERKGRGREGGVKKRMRESLGGGRRGREGEEKERRRRREGEEKGRGRRRGEGERENLCG